MYATAQSIHPVQSIFGAGFVPEPHGDEARCNMSRSEEPAVAEILKRLKALCFGERHSKLIGRVCT